MLELTPNRPPIAVFDPSGYNYNPAPQPEAEAPAVPLSHYLWILRRHRLKILGFIALSVASTLIVSTRLTPIYEATVTVDIDRQVPTGVMGQEANRAALNDSEQFLATQMKLIQSDSVLRPVVRKYKLVDDEDKPAGSSAAAVAEEAPVKLKNLKVSRPANTYLLLIGYRSPDRRLAADVVNAVAESYVEHTYNIRFRSSASLSSYMEKQLEELKAKMERSSDKLAQFERELNVINPEEKTSILSARLLQLNTEHTNAQADRVRKEAAHNSVGGGSIEAAQVSTQGESLRKITERLNEAQEKFAEVKTHYGANHPEYRKAAGQLQEVQQLLDRTRKNIGQRVDIEYREAIDREQMLRKTVVETKKEFDKLNARSFEYQAFKREAEGDKKFYEDLVRKIKEAGINASFQNSSIRVADPARPASKPAFPNTNLNVLLAFLLSTLLGVGAAVVTDILNNTVRDPEQVTRTLNAEVVGTLPVVKDWRGKLSHGLGNAARGSLSIAATAVDSNLSVYDEAVRTLRNSILLTDFDRRLRSLMITSSSPSEGKSTISAHLAIAHAQQGRKTLLIDGDLRRPSVHRRFGIPSATGLSDVLVSQLPWRDVLIRPEENPNLNLLLAGPPSRRAADIIGTALVQILEDASHEYDLIILDSPPLLGFPEPLQMATAVDGVLVVALAGQTNRTALGSTITMLTRLRANVIGVVLNEVRADTGNGYYYHYYHPNYYKQYRAAEVGQG